MEVKSLFISSLLLLIGFTCYCSCIRLKPHKTLKFGTLYVTLYADENFRGDIHTQVIERSGCTNLPSPFQKWASSIEPHKRCVDVCTEVNCTGKCKRLEPNTGALPRLRKIGFNDAISSVKSCYA